MWNPFRSTEETYVGTSVSRLIQDKLMPDINKIAVLQSIFKGTPMLDTMLNSALTGAGIRAEQAYAYGEADYVYGNPSGDFYFSHPDEIKIAAVLSELEGQPVTIEYAVYGALNMLHLAWMQLTKDHGYSPTDNTVASLSAQKGKPVYLHDIRVRVEAAITGSLDSTVLGQWGDPPTKGYSPARKSTVLGLASTSLHTGVERVASGLVGIQAVVDYVWNAPQDQAGHHYTYSSANFVLLNPLNDWKSPYYQVKYVVNGVTKYWIYSKQEGIHPTLDADYSTEPRTGGTFFPFIPFRLGMASAAGEATSDHRKSLQKMMKYFGAEYDSIFTAIQSNPQVDLIEQAYLMMGVPISSTNPVERKYIHDFIHQLYDAGLGNGSVYRIPSQKVGWSDLTNLNQSKSVIVIRDKGITISLFNYGIYKRTFTGSIGKVGEHAFSLSSIAITEGSVPSIQCHHFKKQITPNTYEEIQVLGMGLQYYVYGDMTTGFAGADPAFLIPIDRSISHYYSVSERETLYLRSLHLVFNSRQTIERDWYEQSWFADVLTIAAIVVFVTSIGTGAELSAAMLEGASLLTLVYIVVIEAIVTLAVTAALAYVFKIFAHEVGADVALVFALALAAMGVTNTSTSVGGLQVSAQTLLDISLSLVKGVTADVTDELTKLYKEMGEFNLFKDLKNKELDDANALLEEKFCMNPMMIVGETPDRYFQRTVHSGNVGTVCFDLLHKFVDNALTLPSISSTIGKV